MQDSNTNKKNISFYDDIEQEKNRYLIFTLNQELYGTPLLGVREIIEPQKIKFIPNTQDYFLGVVNVRGQVIGVFDMRKKFDLEINSQPNNAMIIFDILDGAPLAALVDKVESVSLINPNEIDDPHVSSKVSNEFLIGVGRMGEKLINLIDLQHLLSADELINAKQAILSA